jgi:hypothetical protein
VGSPKIPAPPAVPIPPPLPPQLANKDVAAAGANYAASQSAARGLAGTILTSPSGADSGRTFGTKTATGQ